MFIQLTKHNVNTFDDIIITDNGFTTLRSIDLDQENPTGVESEMALTNRWFAIAVITATVLKQPRW
jgi:hypothetical protein